LFEKWNVFEEKLILEILGSGGNNDALAGLDCRHEIGKSFSCAGARFHDQVSALLQRLFDRLGHLKLAAAELVSGMGAGEHSSGREEIVDRTAEGPTLRLAGQGYGGMNTGGH
jgi:hypothetical protein